MKHEIELLAPGGDIKAMKTAIYAGADAIYCGLNKFNARNRATNISFEDLQGILRIAHQHDCAVFLTLNIIILDPEIPALIKLLNRLVNTSIDGVIVQDLGLFHLLSKHFPSLEVHASTQLNTHNEGQIRFLKQLHAERVNLSRELNINEIKPLTAIAHREAIKIEVFVHGSYCISFSGQCYMSSVQSGNSGNRGQCSQPCRERYKNTETGNDYPLNLKDNSAFLDLKELYEAGVDSLKIEGRIKEFEYVYTVVNAWRKQIDKQLNDIPLSEDKSNLYKVFNRDFSNGFLKGKIDKGMYIDNPMNHSITYLSEANPKPSPEALKKKEHGLLQEKEKLRQHLTEAISNYDITALPLSVHVTGTCGTPLTFIVTTPEITFEVSSTSSLSDTGTEALSESMIIKRLKAIDDSPYILQELKFEVEGEVYIPFKELTWLKKRLLYTLNGQREFSSPVVLPKLKKHQKTKHIPTLSVMVSSAEELNELGEVEGPIFYQLPNRIGQNIEPLIALFSAHQELIPWFPAVLIGEDYGQAIELLERMTPRTIVSNNTGLGYESYKRDIDWIAGPQMNLSNSYSLQALKENFKCSGAFLSNELSKQQLLGIMKPDDFKLFFTIYQPLLLMNSRQCFFHQVTGCHKHLIDQSCISQCEKMSRITNTKGEDSIIEKSKGNYHRIYSAHHLLNTELAMDIGDRFASLTLNLSQVNNDTKVNTEKKALLQLFNKHLAGDEEATAALHTTITPTINTSYRDGI